VAAADAATGSGQVCVHSTLNVPKLLGHNSNIIRWIHRPEGFHLELFRPLLLVRFLCRTHAGAVALSYVASESESSTLMKWFVRRRVRRSVLTERPTARGSRLLRSCSPSPLRKCTSPCCIRSSQRRPATRAHKSGWQGRKQALPSGPHRAKPGPTGGVQARVRGEGERHWCRGARRSAGPPTCPHLHENTRCSRSGSSARNATPSRRTCRASLSR
jgi:hypothetical protein